MDVDKKKHYDFCYDITQKAPKDFRLLWGIIVFVVFSIYKEVIHDLLLKKGTPDLKDVEANFEGVRDSILNKEKKK